ncbi:hypothetical protein P691DRAFT_808682 [Macrolepiota fuliginosa MF-IS2]|uniref:Uncharacterized protein n=1 Tax=Macrolepiota fuliginosa MF-IS2 TaxID=1400762 RepID=A0A9P5X6C5_9AGAR|nr:hypothetical protein P691DRAFT_808682 [Macrolepiota fuliginosa MF-IS2]
MRYIEDPDLDLLQMVERMQEAGVIQSCHRSLSSRFKSLFQRGSRDRFISGLYSMGHGPKSYFWYWEVDFDARYYREFRVIDLANGERMFREEPFNLWPEEWQWQKNHIGF